MKITYAAQLSGIYGKSPPNHVIAPSQRLDPKRQEFLNQAPLAMIEAGGYSSFASGSPVAKAVTEQTVLLPIHADEIPLAATQALFEAEHIRVSLFLPKAPLSMSIDGKAEIRLDLALRQPFALPSETIDPILPIAVLRLSIEQTAFHPIHAWMRAKLWSNHAV